MKSAIYPLLSRNSVVAQSMPQGPVLVLPDAFIHCPAIYAADMTITFNYVPGQSERQTCTLTVPAERISTAPLHKLKELPPIKGNRGFYPIVSSDVAVIVEQTRSPLVTENPGPRGGEVSVLASAPVS